jgi:RNA 2',3'-cyclic 3'-phosphodiesterase
MAASRTPPDAPQLDLLGTAHAKPHEIHRLFLALMPNAAARAQFAHAAETLKARHPSLRARWVGAARYHATLHFLGDQPMLRPDIVSATQAAMDTVRCAPFIWTLHYAASFRGRQPPCVLRSDEVPDPLQQLWEDARRSLILAGQGGHLERGFLPHVTLAYSHGAMMDVTPIEPLAWRVDEIALVHSVVGRPDYQLLARWQLAAP